MSARRDDPDALEVPAAVWLVIEPMIGTRGGIRAFRKRETAKAYVGKRKTMFIVGPYRADTDNLFSAWRTR